MKFNFIINAVLVATLWLLPVLVGSTLLDQLMPKIKKDEHRAFTIAMIILQVVLSFILFEVFEKLIIATNKRFFKDVKMPELMNGVIILGLLQSTAQQTLSQRIKMLYGDIDKNLEKIGVE